MALFQTVSCAVAVWSILAIGLHLWPFEGRHSMEMVAPINLGVILWTIIAVAAVIFSSQMRRVIAGNLPDVSVWAFLAMATASVAFSPHVGQSAASLVKLALMYVGAFTFFGVACRREGWASRFCTIALAAACIAMSASVLPRLLGHAGLGFFGNPYKYGTTVAILFTLGGIFLVARSGFWGWLVVPAAALAAVATVSLGGMCGIAVGLLAGMLAIKHRAARLRLAVCLLTLAAIWVVFWQMPVFSHLRDDALIADSNGHDLRQRYIEWQAMLNLLGQRPVAGTGLGCVNEYRSMFYGRLPKLNTLEPFDRNGWLLTAVEMGIFGLVAFVWVVIAAVRKARQAVEASGPQARLAAAAFAALMAACVANTFSSVNCNGVLNSFVLVLALAHHAGRKSFVCDPFVQDEAFSSTKVSVQPAEGRVCDE